MNNKERKEIAHKGDRIKLMLNDVNSMLIIGEPECGKSLLCGYLENSIKEEPLVLELGDIKGKRKHKMKDFSSIVNKVILIDDAHKLDIDSIINNLSLITEDSKKVVMFSSENNSLERIKEHVDKTISFSQI
jgi:ABC-type dipeptide/oligopeptide/nickel transport system ATPase component